MSFNFLITFLPILHFLVYGPNYKSKLELKSNSSDILPVNCKFMCYFAPT